MGDAGDGDGIADVFDTDGDPIDGQVGDARSGRLALSDLDVADPRSDFQARDVGIDGRERRLRRPRSMSCRRTPVTLESYRRR